MLLSAIPQGSYKLNWTCLSLTGSEAFSFFHRQSSQDILSLRDQEGAWSSLLDESSKIVSVHFVVKDKEKLFLYLENSLTETTLARLEKYIITEDVEVSIVKKEIVISFNPFCSSGFKSSLFGFPCFFDTKEEGKNEPLLWLYFQGHKVQSVILNETPYIDLAYNKSKGCFLGQESVSKIESHREAAFKTTLIEILSGDIENELRVAGKKIFDHIFLITHNFYLVQLARDFRLADETWSFDQIIFKVHSFDYIQKQLVDYCQNEFARITHDYSQDNQKMIEELSNLIRMNPYFEDGIEALGLLLGKEEKYPEAIEMMNYLLEVNSKSVMAHTNLSFFYMRVGDIEKAEAEKEKATLKSFDFYASEAKKKEEEIKKQQELFHRENLFKNVLEIDENDVMALCGLAEIYQGQNKKEEALLLTKRALIADPNYTQTYLIHASLILNDPAEAMKILDTGIALALKKGEMIPAQKMQVLRNNLHTSMN